MRCIIMFLMKDEKEGRKKQARSNKQQGKATQHAQGSHFSKKNELPHIHVDTFIQSCHQLIYTNIMHVHVQLILNVHQ